MDKNILQENPNSPWILLIILIGYLAGGMFAFNLLGFLVVIPFFGSFTEAAAVISNPTSPEAQLPVLLVQGVIALGSFFVGPAVFVKVHLQRDPFQYFSVGKMSEIGIPIVILSTISFMVSISPLIEWNMNWDFPDSMMAFENWARNLEDQLAEMTEVLTQFNSFGMFILGLIVIAIIPGITEEYLFRGVIQNLLGQAFKNPHLAIWLSAIIFGVIHMQFYGVVPRILLGVLFGYLYFWSGHLGYAMVAHFMNNGFQLLLLYLYTTGVIEFDVNSEELTSPSTWVIIVFAIFTTMLLMYFRRTFNRSANE